MLNEIYNGRKEIIDEVIKKAIKSVEYKTSIVDYDANKEIIDKLDENYNIKLSAICESIYIQGLKDGINLMKEC